MNAQKNKLLFTPIILWAAIFILCPLIYVFVLSFLSRSENGNILFKFTFENYLRIFDATYINIFLISLLIATLTVIITLFIAYPFAYLIAKMNKKTRMFLLLLVMLPFWTSSLLRTYGWIILLQTEGVVNSFFLNLGIIKEPIQWMFNYAVVLVATAYMFLPFMILPIFNSIEKLDKTLIEASNDLGAGRVRTFLNITLPLTLPGIMGGITLVFIPAVGLFFVADLLGGAKVMLIGNLISNQFGAARNWPFGAALGVTMLVGVGISLLLYRFVSVKLLNSKGEIL